MTTNKNFIIANNVTIVQSPECINPATAILKTDDLSSYFGTIFLAVANSIPVNEEELYGHRTKLFDLCSDKYRLVQPLLVTLSKEDNSFTASSGELNLFGYGNTKDEAIDDLRGVIVEYYEELLGNESRLGKIPTKDKLFLDQIIKKCS